DERVDRAVADGLNQIGRSVEADDADLAAQLAIGDGACRADGARFVRCEQPVEIRKPREKILRDSQAARAIRLGELIPGDLDAGEFRANRVLKTALTLEARAGPRGDAEHGDLAVPLQQFAEAPRREDAALAVVGG